MGNELESDGTTISAMVMNLEGFGVDGVGYDESHETETEPPSSTNPQ